MLKAVAEVGPSLNFVVLWDSPRLSDLDSKCFPLCFLAFLFDVFLPWVFLTDDLRCRGIPTLSSLFCCSLGFPCFRKIRLGWAERGGWWKDDGRWMMGGWGRWWWRQGLLKSGKPWIQLQQETWGLKTSAAGEEFHCLISYAVIGKYTRSSILGLWFVDQK